MSNIAFSQVYMHLYMINIAPEGDPKNWALIGEGITNPSPEPNEVIDQTAYVSGRGMASSDVTGGQLVFKFDGHRVIGDPAQDYIASLLLSYGDNRKTDFKWIAPNGQVIEGPVTIVNIVPGGGDANSKDKFSFEVHYDGMPTFTAGDSTAFPESITARDREDRPDGRRRGNRRAFERVSVVRLRNRRQRNRNRRRRRQRARHQSRQDERVRQVCRVSDGERSGRRDCERRFVTRAMQSSETRG